MPQHTPFEKAMHTNFMELKRLFVLLAILFAALAAASSQPKHETRAVWLTTIGGLDWPHSYARTTPGIERQKAELRDILDKLQQANINTVLLQTRVRGTMIYPSAFEPWDGCMSGVPGKSPGYDPLQFAIDECHKRGMEIHAWIVAIPIGQWNAIGCRNLRRKHPRMVKRIGSEGFLNPESDATAGYIASLCGEIAKRYDIDGIHLDYIRYPETWQIRNNHDRCRQRITRIVRKIHDTVKSIKPYIKLSCSPVGKHDDLPRYSSHGWNAYERVCQDAQGWMAEGLMDMLFPMMYFRGDNFYPFALDWKQESHGRTVAPGLGIYFMSEREKNWPLSDITREMEVLRSNGMGQAMFRSKFFTDNVKGLYSFAKDQFYLYPALPDPMPCHNGTRPLPPSNLALKPVADNVSSLSWNSPYGNDTLGIRFNIYSSPEYPVNTNDASNLMAISLSSTSINVPASTYRHYAITAIDRYGMESEALQENAPDNAGCGSSMFEKLIRCDGSVLQLPAKSNVLDARFIVVESLAGTVVSTHPFSSTSIDIRQQPDGIYVLRSLGRKGVTHRLGHFAIRRSF